MCPDCTGRGSWFLACSASPMCLSPLLIFALYPFTIINHSHEHNCWILWVLANHWTCGWSYRPLLHIHTINMCTYTSNSYIGKKNVWKYIYQAVTSDHLLVMRLWIQWNIFVWIINPLMFGVYRSQKGQLLYFSDVWWLTSNSSLRLNPQVQYRIHCDSKASTPEQRSVTLVMN